MRDFTRIVIAAAALTTAQAALAQDDGSNVGVKVSVSYFTDNEMKRIFGDGQFGFGVSLSKINLSNGWKFGTDFDIVLADRNGSKMLLVPVTAGFGRTFGDVGQDSTVPYFAARAGLAYADYSITRPSNLQRFSTKRFLPTANAEVGLILSKNFRVSARYDMFSEADGFNFNGFKLSVAYHMFKF